MSGVNKVILVGRLGKDPEVRKLDNGAPVANFTVATSESYKDKTTGEKKEVTEWHNIVACQRSAELAGEYLKKGSQVYIEGRLRTDSWDDKETGQKKYRTEIVVNDMVLLGGRGQGGVHLDPHVGEQHDHIALPAELRDQPTRGLHRRLPPDHPDRGDALGDGGPLVLRRRQHRIVQLQPA